MFAKNRQPQVERESKTNGLRTEYRSYQTKNAGSQRSDDFPRKSLCRLTNKEVYMNAARMIASLQSDVCYMHTSIYIYICIFI